MDQINEIDLWCGNAFEGDCLDILRTIPDNSVDLVMCSPPYENARTYGIDFKLKGQDWVDWAFERYLECCRVCRGLVCWVVEGKTRQFRWSATPALLMADLHRAGIKLRKPPAFHRVGIAGSGGPDWLRNDYEFMVCSSHGKLPWSDNTTMGHPPKWAPGGEMSHRVSDGSRVNQRGHPIDSGATITLADKSVRSKGKRPSHTLAMKGKQEKGEKLHTKPDTEAERREQAYLPPALANPGNVMKFNVGGGVMGSRLCHENEAPYPEDLCEFMIRSFCPPGGITLDPFCGSGTTLAVAERHGRRWIGIDVRASQIDLTARRIAESSSSA